MKDLDYKDLPIVKEATDLMGYYESVYRQIANASKHGAVVPGLSYSIRELFTLLIYAGKMYPKKQILLKADVVLDCIKHYIRILNKNKIINSTQYEQLSKHTTTIGKQLGGWINSLKED